MQADVDRTRAERTRQEALSAANSATRQRVEAAVADQERFAAQLASRDADLTQARTLLRSNQLAAEAERRSKAVIESQELQLVADLHAKEAALAVAQVNLSYTRIVAPADGTVGERQVRPGQLVSPGTQVLSFVGGTPWVQANFRETQLTNIKVGDPVDVRIDVYPGEVIHGRVLEIAPASGSQFALLPPDNATGNFTKVVQRVPVKIALEDSTLIDAVAIGIVGGRHRSNEAVREPIEEPCRALSIAATGPVTKPAGILALASALPADLSHTPLLGILAVNMGAGFATLAARFLSLGLADLRGHIGIGVDEGAWIGTAFNAATMFIGPMTVYLGALLGTRRVLLVCSAVFAIVSACLPFAHSYSLLILLMAIAGLSSGTFYPLTLSFALREHSAQVPGADAWRLCDMYRGRPELCAIALRLLSEITCRGRGCSGRPLWRRRSWRRAPITAFRRLRGRGLRDRHRASSDFCTPAPVSRCCSPRSTRDSGSTGGAPACSPRCSRQGSSSSCAR